jgi:glycosyltransferase involved in cell wall biosynthesis
MAPPSSHPSSDRADTLLNAEAARLSTQLGIAAFQKQFWEELGDYKKQRAWRLMLLARKAYSLACMRGWGGRWRLAKWLAAAPFRGFTGLEEYDLTFSKLAAYLPPAAQPLIDVALPAITERQSFPQSSRAEAFDVLILPVFDYEFRRQRPQHLAAEFARAGHRVFWISPSRRAIQPYEARPLMENLWEIRLGSAIPDPYSGELAETGAEQLCHCLAELYEDAGMTASCAILQLPFWRPLAIQIRSRFGTRLIYDCMDKWAAFPGFGESNRRQETALWKDADLLAVTAHSLGESARKAGVIPVVIPNAVDYSFVSKPRASNILQEYKRPIIGYIGAIAEWFDYKLFHVVARIRPSYSFILVGGYGLETHVFGDQVRRLKSLPNVYLLGHKDYIDVPDYLAAFDVCIIPFVINEVTAATDPVKIYEYFSQGKPVVATPLPELQRFGPLVALAATAEEFASKLDEALANKEADATEQRIRFAQENTWQRRYEVFANLIGSIFAARAPMRPFH